MKGHKIRESNKNVERSHLGKKKHFYALGQTVLTHVPMHCRVMIC